MNLSCIKNKENSSFKIKKNNIKKELKDLDRWLNKTHKNLNK